MEIIKLKKPVIEIKHLTEWVQQQIKQDKGRVGDHKDRLQNLLNLIKEKIDYISIVSENYGTTIKNKKPNIFVIKVLESEEEKNTVLENVQRNTGGSSLVVKCLGLGAFTAMAWGSIPSWRTKIPQAVCQGQKDQSINLGLKKKKG